MKIFRHERDGAGFLFFDVALEDVDQLSIGIHQVESESFAD